MSPRDRIKMALALLFVLATVAASASGQVCSPQVLKAVRETGTGADMHTLDLAMARLKRIESLVGEETWDRVARETINIVDANLGSATPITIHHWVQTTLQGTDEEIAAVIQSVDRLRDAEGKLYRGIVLKPGLNDGSSTWIINAKSGNRGFLFEVRGADYLIRTGYVDGAQVEGLGIRILNSQGRVIEGDLVERIGAGGRRFVDFKARDGNYALDELDRIDLAIRDGKIQHFVFAKESGTNPPSAWQAKLDSINDGLLQNGFRPIDVISGGTFP